MLLPDPSTFFSEEKKAIDDASFRLINKKVIFFDLQEVGHAGITAKHTNIRYSQNS
jgi:hypothetical protein